MSTNDKFWISNLKRLSRIHTCPRGEGPEPRYLDPDVSTLAYILLCHLEDHHKLKGRPRSEIEKFLTEKGVTVEGDKDK